MKHLKIYPFQLFKLAVLSLFFVSCAVQLAPSYDDQLIDGLNQLNEKSNVYFESMSGDISTKKYEKFEAKYDDLIGKTQALITQSSARPVPDNKLVKKINKTLEKSGKPIWDPNNNLPSTVALEGILGEYKKLKALHEDGTINGTKFELGKNAIILYLDQATVFEYALER